MPYLYVGFLDTFAELSRKHAEMVRGKKRKRTRKRDNEEDNIEESRCSRKSSPGQEGSNENLSCSGPTFGSEDDQDPNRAFNG